MPNPVRDKGRHVYAGGGRDDTCGDHGLCRRPLRVKTTLSIILV